LSFVSGRIKSIKRSYESAQIGTSGRTSCRQTEAILLSEMLQFWSEPRQLDSLGGQDKYMVMG
jgi:hypothetical protein